MSDPNAYLDRVIGKYKIIELLGRGGMAVVYKAYQEGLDRYVAIKLMHSFLADEGEFLERFKREARAMALLKHPHIADVYDFDVVDDTYYIVMEFVSGGSLKEEIEHFQQRGERMPLSQAVRIMLELIDAVSYAHARGMIHRDIKPGNIMLRADGGAVLTDFGIAKIMGVVSHTLTGAMVGTPAYMAPEQGMGHLGDERSDLYSLGILFFHLITGRLPFESTTPLAVVMKHVTEPLPPPITFNPDIPAGIQDVILRVTAKDPQQRYQTGYEFAQAMRQALYDEGGELLAELPPELLRDEPAAAVSTLAAQTRITANTPYGRNMGRAVSLLEATMPAEATVVRPRAPQPAAAQPAAAQPGRVHRFRWLAWGFVGILAIVLAAVAGAYAVSWRTPEPTPVLVAAPPATDTPAPTDTATPAAPTPDFAGTAVAAIILTETAMPTVTPAAPTTTPTPSPTPTQTTTPDLTATHIANCVFDLELVNYYTYDNPAARSAPTGLRFPLKFELRNSGTCAWPAGWQLTVQDGSAFQRDDPLVLEEPVPPSSPVMLSVSLVAPADAGNYDTIWQLRRDTGEPVGPPINVALRIYVAATSTPAITPAPSLTPSPTIESVSDIGFSVVFNWCEYAGDEWRCEVVIAPFGGVGAPYTIWVFDADQPARYFGGNQFHIISARRCAPWIHEIRVQDEAGYFLSRNLAFDPVTDPTVAPLFPEGNCVTP
ncbi:MAG: hypothetical protein Fur0021_27080 [Candidatus Promineifilaceae bacterium]